MKRTVTPRSLLLLGALAALALLAAGVRSRTAPANPAPVTASEVAAAPTPAVVAPALASAPLARAAATRPARTRAAKAALAAVPAPPSVPHMDAGLRAFIDPETGTLGAPTQEQLEALGAEATLNESTEGLEQVTLPDGSVMMDLQGRFQDYYMVRLDAKGNRTVVCGRDQRAQFQNTPAPAALPEER